jgi:hypothetical protein
MKIKSETSHTALIYPNFFINRQFFPLSDKGKQNKTYTPIVLCWKEAEVVCSVLIFFLKRLIQLLLVSSSLHLITFVVNYFSYQFFPFLQFFFLKGFF